MCASHKHVRDKHNLNSQSSSDHNMISKNIVNLNMALFDPDNCNMFSFKSGKSAWVVGFVIIESNLSKSQNRIPIRRFFLLVISVDESDAQTQINVFITTKNYSMLCVPTNSIVT